MKLKLTKEEKKALKAERKAKGLSVFKEFKKFVLRGNVIDMAVGVIVATAFTKIVTSLTSGIFMPLITWLIGDMKFDEVKTVLREADIQMVDGVETIVQAEIALNWGTVIENIINFLLIAIIIFTIVKVINSFKDRLEYLKDKLTKKDEEKPVEVAPVVPQPTTNELLTEIIGILKDKKEEK